MLVSRTDLPDLSLAEFVVSLEVDHFVETVLGVEVFCFKDESRRPMLDPDVFAVSDWGAFGLAFDKDCKETLQREVVFDFIVVVEDRSKF